MGLLAVHINYNFRVPVLLVAKTFKAIIYTCKLQKIKLCNIGLSRALSTLEKYSGVHSSEIFKLMNKFQKNQHKVLRNATAGNTN
jgi:hypothetical protein